MKVLTICALVFAFIAASASAALVGGTYNNAGAPTASWAATAPVSGRPLQYKTVTAPNAAGSTSQGYPVADGNGTGAILSEIVTPSTSFKLDTISFVWAGAAANPTGLSLHLYTLGTASIMPALASDSSAFYFANTDLLGGGAGLPFSVIGVPSTAVVNFRLDNTTTSDQVTLTAGTSYAVELWNNAPSFNQNAITWLRNSDVDPGGQAFAKMNTSDFTTSRNTIAANGLAGGSPRTFYMALYGASVGGTAGDYNQDGRVNAIDYTVWRDTLGQSALPPGSGADGDSSGTVDPNDFNVWKSAFGTGGPGAAAAAPEPGSVILAAMAGIFGLALAAARRRAEK